MAAVFPDQNGSVALTILAIGRWGQEVPGACGTSFAGRRRSCIAPASSPRICHSKGATILPEWLPGRASRMTWQNGSDESRGPMEDRPIPGISLTAIPSGTGCLECLNGDGPGWWLHLRRCAQCGHIGCCDSSPSQHASAHARTVGHAVMRSFEPGENWFYQHTTKKFFHGPRLPDPQSRPLDQPSPAPADKVPADWRDHLHR